MKRLYTILLILLVIQVSFVAAALAGDYTINDAVGICDDYITDLYPGSKIGNACRATDMGSGWFIVWNMACPLILADPQTGPRRTGAACEVDKTTGNITYLAVSARELIK
jgi:hypothetical protein